MSKAIMCVLGIGLLLASVPSVSIGAPVSKSAESPVIDVRLSVPEGSMLHSMVPRMTLDISPETNVAVVVVATARKPSSPRPMTSVMLADLKTGKLSPISDLIGKGKQGRAAGIQLSPDRKRVLVNWMEREGAAVYAIELPDGKPVKVAEGRVMALWAGDKIAVSSVTQAGKLAKVILVDPATGKSDELPVCGMVAVGLPDGSVLVGGDPNAPAAELSVAEACTKGRLFHVGANGRVLRDIAPIGIISSPPVASANGMFVAFQSKPADAREGPGTKYGFTIVSTDGKDKNELTSPYFPIAVMDNGAAVVISSSSDEDNLAAVSWVSKDGKKVTEIVKAVSATVVGKSLIYATNKDVPAIRTTSLPEQ